MWEDTGKGSLRGGINVSPSLRLKIRENACHPLGDQLAVVEVELSS